MKTKSKVSPAFVFMGFGVCVIFTCYHYDILNHFSSMVAVYLLLLLFSLSGALRQENLSKLAQGTLIFLMMCLVMFAWGQFSNLFAVKKLLYHSSYSMLGTILWYRFAAFFLSILLLAPILLASFNKHPLAIAFIIATPTLYSTANLDFGSLFATFLSLANIQVNILAIFAAVWVPYYVQKLFAIRKEPKYFISKI